MQHGNGTTAPLKNVGLFLELAERVMNRPGHLPGMATFHGFSGYGKTFSAVLAANKYRATYLEVDSWWGAVDFREALLAALKLTKARTKTEKMNLIIEMLSMDDQLLIIDEFDHVAAKGYVDFVRSIHDKSGCPIILIGEEELPRKLGRWERFSNRVMDWVPAQPSDLDDVRHLAKLYASEITIADDLLNAITDAASGRARRACVSIERVRELARTEGIDSVDLAAWGDRPLFMERPPARRG